MTPDTFKARLLATGADPHGFELPRDPGAAFKAMQTLVGGYLERVLLADGLHGWNLVAYVNEDAIALGHQFNRRIGPYDFFGVVVVVREYVERDGDVIYADVTTADDAFLARSERPRQVARGRK